MPPGARAGLGDSAIVGPHLRAVLATLAAPAALVVLVSCDNGSREDRFCDRLADDQALLAVVPTDPDELDAFVERYQDLAAVAPLAIEQQWGTITELVEAVATEDLTDPATADRLRDRAVAATRPIDEVRAYARTTCGVELVVAATPGTATTETTLPGTTTTTLPAPGTVPPVAP
jgi:phage tail protein X